MAKQSGIHQLRGKVGEMSYYRQSGVQQGLVRSINQGLSARVKTSQEFANTRLNNAEFKTATEFSAALLNGVVPIYRPMFNVFRNAKLSGKVLSIIKSNTGSWGDRLIAQTNALAVAQAMNDISKNRASDLLGFQVSEDDNRIKVEYTVAESMADTLSSIGADGLILKSYDVAVYEGTPVAPGQERARTLVRTGAAVTEDISSSTAAGDTSESFVTPLLPDLSILTGRTVVYFVYMILMPYRTVNNVQHVLQEACCYAIAPDSYNRA